MAQPEFAFALADKIKEEGLNLGLETCGFFSEAIDFSRFKLFDFVYFDLKHHDPNLHESYTGKSNQRILHNLKTLCQAIGPEAITLSLPIIPTVNGDELFIHWVLNLAKELGISKTRLLPYHEYGKSKYPTLQRAYLLENQPHWESRQYQHFASLLKAGGLACEIVGFGD